MIAEKMGLAALTLILSGAVVITLFLIKEVIVDLFRKK